MNLQPITALSPLDGRYESKVSALRGHFSEFGLIRNRDGVERDVAADIAFDGDGALTIEAVGDFAFTEFGIKPFSAALGAVRNKDAFRVYVNVTAAPSDVR